MCEGQNEFEPLDSRAERGQYALAAVDMYEENTKLQGWPRTLKAALKPVARPPHDFARDGNPTRPSAPATDQRSLCKYLIAFRVIVLCSLRRRAHDLLNDALFKPGNKFHLEVPGDSH
jgi:hypothetical protein